MKRPTGLIVIAVLIVLSRGGQARAQAPQDPKRAEAAERFDRGIALLEEGDNAGALAEFKRVYDLSPHWRVLYNIGLAYAAMNRPVEATQTLEKVLKTSAPMPKDSLEIARRKHEEQKHRVGFVNITSNVPAAIEVNGVAVAKTPMNEPMWVPVGTTIVSAISPGHLPARSEITVAGETTITINLVLSPSDARLAHLLVKTDLPDADVLIDGEKVGLTPLPGSITVAPGKRVVELRRPGYVSAQKEIALSDGASAELAFALEEAADVPGGRGRLVLTASESEAEVTVDGRPRGPYLGPLSLVPGSHKLQVVRAGFLSTERLVSVPANGDANVKVTLVPTPETRVAYKSRNQSQRTWGWVAGIGGAAVAAGAAALVATNAGPRSDSLDHREQVKASKICGMDALSNPNQCVVDLAAADDEVNSRNRRHVIGLVALGVGAASAILGTVLLLTADDPNRYDIRSRESDFTVSSWLAPTGGGLSLAGRF
jgi:hypothetical protein